MRRIVAALGLGALLASACITISTDRPAPSGAPLASGLAPGGDEGALDRALRSVVKIFVLDEAYDLKGSCSGTPIHAAGYIITNWHCVGDPDTGRRHNEDGIVAVGLTKDAQTEPVPEYFAQALAGSPKLDVAIVKIVLPMQKGAALPKSLPIVPTPIGDSDRVKVGDRVHVFGYVASGGDLVTRTSGQISGYIDRDGDGKVDAFKYDAKGGGGQSGGLAVNDRGEQIAVHALGLKVQATDDRFGGGVLINLAKPLIEEALAAGGTGVGRPTDPKLPGLAPPGARPAATPPPARPTPAPPARPTATPARATPAPPAGQAASGESLVGGQLVDADTKRPIGAGEGAFGVLKPGISYDQFTQATPQQRQAMILFEDETDEKGIVLVGPVARGQTYTVVAVAEGYSVRSGTLKIPADAPQLVKFGVFELKKR